MSDPNIIRQDSSTPDGADAAAKNAEASDLSAPKKLSKEEQWALFEKELKESDWGHQPC